MTPGSQLLSADEFARFLKIGQRTFRRWKAEGKLPPPDLQEGRIERWSAGTIAAWMSGRASDGKGAGNGR